jgi:hypothetical protein
MRRAALDKQRFERAVASNPANAESAAAAAGRILLAEEGHHSCTSDDDGGGGRGGGGGSGGGVRIAEGTRGGSSRSGIEMPGDAYRVDGDGAPTRRKRLATVLGRKHAPNSSSLDDGPALEAAAGQGGGKRPKGQPKYVDGGGNEVKKNLTSFLHFSAERRTEVKIKERR